MVAVDDSGIPTRRALGEESRSRGKSAPIFGLLLRVSLPGGAIRRGRPFVGFGDNAREVWLSGVPLWPRLPRLPSWKLRARPLAGPGRIGRTPDPSKIHLDGAGENPLGPD